MTISFRLMGTGARAFFTPWTSREEAYQRIRRGMGDLLREKVTRV
jgi:hypothetical protein